MLVSNRRFGKLLQCLEYSGVLKRDGRTGSKPVYLPVSQPSLDDVRALGDKIRELREDICALAAKLGYRKEVHPTQIVYVPISTKHRKVDK